MADKDEETVTAVEAQRRQDAHRGSAKTTGETRADTLAAGKYDPRLRGASTYGEEAKGGLAALIAARKKKAEPKSAQSQAEAIEKAP